MIQRRTAHAVVTSRFSKAIRSAWIAGLLMLSTLLLSNMAAAQTSPPSLTCPTMNMSVATSGTAQLDLGSCADFPIGFIGTLPTNGTATRTLPHAVTYAHASNFSLGGPLPAALVFDASAGVLSGTPVEPGRFPVTVTATDSFTGTGAPFFASSNYTIQIAAPTIAVAPATLPNGTTGTAYSQTLVGIGGIAPYAFSVTVGALPAGLATVVFDPSARGTHRVSKHTVLHQAMIDRECASHCAAIP